jgi:hypothetical protein
VLESATIALEPGSFLVDVSPVRQYKVISVDEWKTHVNLIATVKYIPDWFPGATFKRIAVKWRKVIDELVAEHFAYVLAQQACFAL